MKRIFVLGCGHSGTSLMIRILGFHDDIFAISGETGIFLNLKEEGVRIKIKEFDREAEKKEKVAWVEKTPKHVQKIAEICQVVPDVKIIAMVRNPKDTACSLKARGFSFEEGLQRWIDDNTIIMKEIHRRNVHILSLEDLVADFSGTIKEVLDFLELPFQDLSNYYLKKESWYANRVIAEKPSNAKGNNHEILRNWQINQPIMKNIERFDTDMDLSDKEIFDNKLTEIESILNKLNVVYKL